MAAAIVIGVVASGGEAAAAPIPVGLIVYEHQSEHGSWLKTPRSCSWLAPGANTTTKSWRNPQRLRRELVARRHDRRIRPRSAEASSHLPGKRRWLKPPPGGHASERSLACGERERPLWAVWGCLVGGREQTALHGRRPALRRLRKRGGLPRIRRWVESAPSLETTTQLLGNDVGVWLVSGWQPGHVHRRPKQRRLQRRRLQLLGDRLGLGTGTELRRFVSQGFDWGVIAYATYEKVHEWTLYAFGERLLNAFVGHWPRAWSNVLDTKGEIPRSLLL